MAQEKKSGPLNDGRILPKDPVTVYATDADPFHKTGEKYTVHSALAAKLIEAGKATETAPEGEGKKPKPGKKAEEGGATV